MREHSVGWIAAPERFRASIEVSLGNPKCAGPQLACLCEWLVRHFGSFEVSVGDTLLGHNYHTIGHPVRGVVELPEALELARAEGDRWLECNESILCTRLPHDTRIVRWDDWKAHPKFNSELGVLKASMVSDMHFMQSVMDDIVQYLSRRGVHLPSLTDSKRLHLSEYILEELAVYSIQAGERPTVNVYPGKPLDTLLNIGAFRTLPQPLRQREFCYVSISST